MEKQLLERFNGKDSAGEQVTIQLHQLKQREHFGSVSYLTNGPKEFSTFDGKVLERLGKGKFQVIETGELITSDDSFSN